MNKRIIFLSLIVSLIVSVAPLLFRAPAPTGGVYNSTDTNPANVVTDGTITANGVQDLRKVLTLKGGTNGNFTHWKNTSAADWYIDDVSIYTAGTASSSVRVYAFATSTDPIAAVQYTNPTVGLSNRMINGVLIATSTAATTTSSTIEAALNTKNLNRSYGQVRVPPGWELLVWIQNATGNTNMPRALCDGSTCEAATSTNLGIFPVQAVIHGFSTTTEPLSPFQR